MACGLSVAAVADVPETSEHEGHFVPPHTSHLRLPTVCLLREVLGTVGALFGGSVVLTDMQHTLTTGTAIVGAIRAAAGTDGALPEAWYDVWLHGARAMGALWRIRHVQVPGVIDWRCKQDEQDAGFCLSNFLRLTPMTHPAKSPNPVSVTRVLLSGKIRGST
jgi:hypothetical protein